MRKIGGLFTGQHWNMWGICCYLKHSNCTESSCYCLLLGLLSCSILFLWCSHIQRRILRNIITVFLDIHLFSWGILILLTIVTGLLSKPKFFSCHPYAHLTGLQGFMDTQLLELKVDNWFFVFSIIETFRQQNCQHFSIRWITIIFIMFYECVNNILISYKLLYLKIVKLLR